MPPLPLSLPPGIYSNGTAYAAKNRWRLGNLVRWVDGNPRVVGGWERRLDADEDRIPAIIPDVDVEAMRGGFGWRDNLGGRYVALGTTLRLLILNSTGTIDDITPVTFTPGTLDTQLLTGYGVGQYGMQAYGTARSGAGALAAPVGAWRFDAWGEDLLAAGPLGTDTKLFAWTPGDLLAVVVPNAPEDFTDFLVTAERIVMTVGGGDAGRLVQWSDREDREDWTPTLTNTADSRFLPGKGKLVAIVALNEQYLILGENDAWLCRFVGSPFVYGFKPAGQDCGPTSARSVVVVAGVAYWPSAGRGFWKHDGGTLQPLPCDVEDFFQLDRNENEQSKMHGFHLSAFNEIWWFYQGRDALDVTRYISYNYLRNEWMTGGLARGVALDRGVTRDVLMVSSRDGFIYNHELPANAHGSSIPFLRSGPIELDAGGQIMYGHFLHHDLSVPLETEFQFFMQDQPQGEYRASPVYAPADRNPNDPIPIRIRGRSMEFEVRGTGAGWRMGAARVDLTVGGGR